MLLLQLNSYFDQMKMSANRHILFADWGRLIWERDKYEVPGNWRTVIMGEMCRWCDAHDSRLLEILLLHWEKDVLKVILFHRSSISRK